MKLVQAKGVSAYPFGVTQYAGVSARQGGVTEFGGVSAHFINALGGILTDAGVQIQTSSTAQPITVSS